MEDKAECWKSGEAFLGFDLVSKTYVKECRYKCFYRDTKRQDPDKGYMRLCLAPVDRRCYEMVWASPGDQCFEGRSLITVGVK